MQEHLFSHFSMAGHSRFLSNVSITFIDKTDPSDPLRREDYWRQYLKTMVPYELNIEDNVRWVFLCLLFLPSNISFLHSNVSMFLRFLFWNNGVCFVSLCYCQCCCFYIITVAINFIVIIIFICISNIIVIIIIVLALFFVLPLFQCYCCQYITNPYYRS